MVKEAEALQPLILTLWIEEGAHQYFNALRQQYFPPERNYLQAHLTLFYALPDEKETLLLIYRHASTQKVFTALAERVVSIGNGTAVKVVSAELKEFHRTLQRSFTVDLTGQDRQKLWPHITIQNKVSREITAAVFAEVDAQFKPFEFAVLGLELHRYCNGPWQLIEKIKFGEKNGS